MCHTLFMKALYVPPSLQREAALLASHVQSSAVLEIGGKKLTLSLEMIQILKDCLEPISQGRMVRVVPLETELSTQEAAELLGVSRPYLIQLLEGGEIPYRKVGTHRRIRAQDLYAYRQRAIEQGRRLASELTQEAQELGLGY